MSFLKFLRERSVVTEGDSIKLKSGGSSSPKMPSTKDGDKMAAAYVKANYSSSSEMKPADLQKQWDEKFVQSVKVPLSEDLLKRVLKFPDDVKTFISKVDVYDFGDFTRTINTSFSGSSNGRGLNFPVKNPNPKDVMRWVLEYYLFSAPGMMLKTTPENKKDREEFAAALSKIGIKLHSTMTENVNETEEDLRAKISKLSKKASSVYTKVKNA